MRVTLWVSASGLLWMKNPKIQKDDIKYSICIVINLNLDTFCLEQNVCNYKINFGNVLEMGLPIKPDIESKSQIFNENEKLDE